MFETGPLLGCSLVTFKSANFSGEVYHWQWALRSQKSCTIASLLPPHACSSRRELPASHSYSHAVLVPSGLELCETVGNSNSFFSSMP